MENWSRTRPTRWLIVVDGLWCVVGAQHRGQDAGPDLGGAGEVAQVAQVQGRLARHEHQRTRLLQGDIRRPGDQVVRDRVRDPRHGVHAARDHHHPHRQERTTGHRRGQILRSMHHIRQLLNRGNRPPRGLNGNRATGTLGDNQMRLHRAALKHLQQPDPQLRHRRPREAHDKPLRNRHSHPPSSPHTHQTTHRRRASLQLASSNMIGSNCGRG